MPSPSSAGASRRMSPTPLSSSSPITPASSPEKSSRSMGGRGLVKGHLDSCEHMRPATARQRRLAYLSWLTVCIVWGTTYLGIRVCLETMPPMLMGGFRWLSAGAVLAAYVLASGESLPGRERWGGIALLGFLMLGLGNGGVVVAEQWV